MEYEVIISTKATSQLRRIDQRYTIAIKTKIAMLKDFPDVYHVLDIKHLNGNQYRIRHGDYRIFFEVIDGVPKIINIMQVKRRTSRTYKKQ